LDSDTTSKKHTDDRTTEDEGAAAATGAVDCGTPTSFQEMEAKLVEYKTRIEDLETELAQSHADYDFLVQRTNDSKKNSAGDRPALPATSEGLQKELVDQEKEMAGIYSFAKRTLDSVKKVRQENRRLAPLQKENESLKQQLDECIVPLATESSYEIWRIRRNELARMVKKSMSSTKKSRVSPYA